MAACFRVQPDKESLVKEKQEKEKSKYIVWMWFAKDFSNIGGELREGESRFVQLCLLTLLLPQTKMHLFYFFA